MYLIRSMSTTDYAPQYGQYDIVKYHIYLLSERNRDRAYWSATGPFQLFSTPQEAEAYGNRVLSDKNFQVVPVDDSHMPNYWDLR